jgi:hypothetical protein
VSREFLVTKFVCAKCGHNLTVTYDAPKKNDRYSDGEPTGAAMVKQLVAIEPCTTCAAPAKNFVKALHELTKEGGAA